MRTLFSIGLIASACMIGSGAGANPSQQDKRSISDIVPSVTGRTAKVDREAISAHRRLISPMQNGNTDRPTARSLR